MRGLLLIAMCSGLSLFSLSAQELGRAPLTTTQGEGLGRAPLSRPRMNLFPAAGTYGGKVSLGWVSMDWDLGPVSGSENLFRPQASFFYKATDNLDVNLSAIILSGGDESVEFGATEADMTRLAVGVRYWVNTQGRITPYFGGGIGYYFVDGNTDRTRMDERIVPASVSVDNTPGAFVEGGAAFQVHDTLYVTADLTYDFLLGSADARINGQSEDFDVSALSINLGVALLF